MTEVVEHSCVAYVDPIDKKHNSVSSMLASKTEAKLFAPAVPVC